MSDIPEYQRRQGIQPADGSGSFTSALGGVTQSYQAVSDIGAKLAQSSANEVYSQLGQEAGKTPGRNLHPAFTDADKHFVEAYKQQEYAIAATQGSDLLRKLSFDASNNPTPNALKDYEKNAYQGLEGILGGLTPGTEAALRSKFDESYSANYYKIAQEVENENQRVMKLNAKLFLDDRIKQSADLNAEGDAKGAKELDKDTVNWLKNGSGVVGITGPEAKEYSETLRKANEAAQARYEMNRADIMGLGEKLLEEQLLQPRTEENNIRSEAMLEAYKQRKSFQAAHNSILFDDASTRLDTNQLSPTDMIDLQSQMNAPTFAKFKHKAEIHFQKQREQQNTFDYISQNSDQPVNLSRITGEARDKYLDNEVAKRVAVANSMGIPMQDNLLTRALVASNVHMEFPSLTKSIDAAVKSGMPDKMEDAGRAIQYLGQRNSSAISKIDAKVIDASEDFNALVKNRVDPVKAAEMAMKKLDPLSDADYAERQLQIQTIRKDYSGTDIIRKKVASTMGWSADAIPSGCLNEFRRVYEQFYLEGGSADIAEQKAKSYMGASWGEEDFNGFKEVVFSPISRAYPGSKALLRQQFIEQAEQVFALKQEAVESGRSMDGVYFEFHKDIDDATFPYKEKQPGHLGVNYPLFGATPNLIKGEKILADGGRQKGIFMIQADEATRLPEDGRVSYAISFRRDGEIMAYPIMDPNTGERIRFTPDTSKAHKDRVSIEEKEYAWRSKIRKDLYEGADKRIEKGSKILEEKGLINE